jgi:type IV secretory pathway VirB2 component (pilin)
MDSVRREWVQGEGMLRAMWLGWALTLSLPVWAQESPFLSGATSLQENIFAWLTPVAIILVMIAGGLAMAGRASWGWFIGLLIGIPIAFGAPQILAWIRGMFAV